MAEALSQDWSLRCLEPVLVFLSYVRGRRAVLCQVCRAHWSAFWPRVSVSSPYLPPLSVRSNF